MAGDPWLGASVPMILRPNATLLAFLPAADPASAGGVGATLLGYAHTTCTLMASTTGTLTGTLTGYSGSERLSTLQASAAKAAISTAA